jgi:hypothetical protein
MRFRQFASTMAPPEREPHSDRPRGASLSRLSLASIVVAMFLAGLASFTMELLLPRTHVATTVEKRRSLAVDAAAPRQTPQRSDQPRCCGNPSWIMANRHLRWLAG